MNSKQVEGQAPEYGYYQAKSFGTTREEYHLWVDYIFDWFGATLDHRFRRYAVSAAFATVIWLVGLAILAPFGLAYIYVTTPGVYYFWVGIAWCIGALRWLSQIYHVRTNRVRPCFQQIDNTEYKRIVSPFAARATQNWQIFIRSLPIIAATWLYFFAVAFSTGHLGSALQFAFPRAFPTVWHSGRDIVPKLAVLDLLSAVAIVHVYTGARLTLSTAPLYARLSKLRVIPVPRLVSELFRGILDLYRTGTLMWSFGIVLAEFLYDARLDFLGITFVVMVVVMGIVAFSLPRVAVRTIVHNARFEALDVLLSDISRSTEKHTEPVDVIKWNEIMATVGDDSTTGLGIGQFMNLAAGQLLPALPLIINTFGKHYFG